MTKNALQNVLEDLLKRMIGTHVVSTKTHMVILARSDVDLPEAFSLLGKRVPVYRDDTIPVETTEEWCVTDLYLIPKRDYTRNIKHAD